MKILVTAACIISTMVCADSFAQTHSNSYETSTLELINQYQSDAQRVGLDEYSYINAVQRYTQYIHSFSPEIYGEIIELEGVMPANELPAFIRILQGEELTPDLITEWVKQKNLNDAKLANFLQIDVKYLERFEKVYTQAMVSGKTIGNYGSHMGVNSTERIIVEYSCKDVCTGFGLSPRDYVELAREADKVRVYGYVRDFLVKFYSRDGQYLKTEVWRKNRGGTIWKERASDCDSDIACPVEP
ncbi:hypothetical protein [Pseudoalteromonas viridis]|uniref:Uncharacterized protein n=1 Tax=Pseudoalteromonas viridis TaxID=339617 RepID=A0ABX7V744_9GAMM|nr:hypothetical protein [Pseudoalteromonas viridis]QTL36315.1 hypothetical protein J5X90_04490 [Pseudoalteromonas viridis]